MGLLVKALQRWLTDRDLQDLAEAEVKAVIDALALALYADFKINTCENDEFESLLMVLSWGRDPSAFDSARYAEVARMKAGAVKDPEALDAYARDVAARLHGTVREKCYSMIVTLTVADNELSTDEEDVLRTFAKAFDIDDARSEAIYQATLKALNKVEA